VFLKKKRVSSKTIKSYITGLRLFYDMNDLTTLNWKKTTNFNQNTQIAQKTRPYSREKIQRLLEIAQQRDRAIYFVDGLIRNKGRFYSRTTHKKLGDNRKVRNILNHGLPKVKFKVYYFFALLKHPGR
jgi:hypothetical protein